MINYPYLAYTRKLQEYFPNYFQKLIAHDGLPTSNRLGPQFLGLGFLSPLYIRNGALQCIREIDMEQRPIQAVHDGNLGPGFAVHLASPQLLGQVTTGRARSLVVDVVVCRHGLGSLLLDILGPLATKLIIATLCDRCGTGIAANLRHAEDGLPAIENDAVARRGGIPKAGRGQGATGPSVVDAGDVPINFAGSRVPIELIADIDEVLDGCHVDVVDGREIENDCFESWTIRVIIGKMASARSRVVPRTILPMN